MNLASREALLQIPGLDAAKADEIVATRAHGKLTSLNAFALDDDALSYLTVDGPTTLHRIRALPLETFSPPPAAAHR